MTETLKGALQELLPGCYIVALRLSELEFADGCDHCPCAPPRTVAEIHLALLSRKLRRLSDETWQSSQANPYNDERINQRRTNQLRQPRTPHRLAETP